MLLGSKRCTAAPDCRMAWSGAACCRQGHQWVACTAAHLAWTVVHLVRADEQHFEPLLWTTNFSFWLILLFYNFVLRPRVWHAVKFLLALQLRYSCNMYSQVWWTEWRKSFITKFFRQVSAKVMKFGLHLANFLHTVKGSLFKTCRPK